MTIYPSPAQEIILALSVCGCKLPRSERGRSRASRPSFPIRLQDVANLQVGYRVLTSDLQGGSILEVQHDRVWQLLSILVRHIRHLEVGQLVLTWRRLLVLSWLEPHSTCVINGYYAPFPKLGKSIS